MNKSDLMHLLAEYTLVDNSKKRDELMEITIVDMTIYDLNFSEYNLCGTVFLRNKFDSCVFYTTNLTHTDFSGSLFCRCSFDQNWIYKSTWDDVKFIHSSIASLEATKTDFYDIVMQNCKVKDSKFKRCSFVYVDSELQDAIACTIFLNCVFDQCDFENCNFKSVKFIGCTFVDSKIDTANSGILFTNCDFSDN